MTTQMTRCARVDQFLKWYELRLKWHELRVRAPSRKVPSRTGHPTSCTEKLCHWYDSMLKPLRVGLTCVLADIYKAAWIDNTHKEELDRKASTRSASSPCAGFHRDSPRLHESRCSRSAPSLHARGSSC